MILTDYTLSCLNASAALLLRLAREILILLQNLGLSPRVYFLVLLLSKLGEFDLNNDFDDEMKGFLYVFA